MNHDMQPPPTNEAPNDVKRDMPDPTIKLCADCVDAYRNGIEPGETACEERHNDEVRNERMTEAGAKVVDALKELYRAVDGDEAAVGEVLYECDKAARRSWNEADHG